MPDSLSSFFHELLTGEESKRLMREDKISRMKADGVDMRPRMKAVTPFDKIKDLIFGRAENTLGEGPVSTAVNMGMGDVDPSNVGKAILPPFGRKVVPIEAIEELANKVRQPRLRDFMQIYSGRRQPSFFDLQPGRLSSADTVLGTALPAHGSDLEGFVNAVAERYPNVDPDAYRLAVAPSNHWLVEGAEGSFRHSAPTSPDGLGYPRAPRITVRQGAPQPVNTALHEAVHGYQHENGLVDRYPTKLPWEYQPHEIQAIGSMVPESMYPENDALISLQRILAEKDRDPLTEILTGINANAKQFSRIRTGPGTVIKEGYIPLSDLSDAFIDSQLPTLNLDLARQGSPLGIQIKRNTKTLSPKPYREIIEPQDMFKRKDMGEFSEILQEILKMHGTLP